LPHVTVKHRHLGTLAGNAAASEAVTADSGKPLSFILCEKKYE